jgi:hypothetical protein
MRLTSLARPYCGLSIQQAAERFDVIVFSGAGVMSPVTQVRSQRLGQMVAAASTARATESDVAMVRREYGDIKAKLLGIALLLNTHTSLGRSFWMLFPRDRDRAFVLSIPTAAGTPGH